MPTTRADIRDQEMVHVTAVAIEQRLERGQNHLYLKRNPWRGCEIGLLTQRFSCRRKNR
jgi:hypothetical protein